jgi:hypothetical protein
MRLGNNHVYNAAATLDTELNCSGCQCEQSVVLAATYVSARVEVSSTLTNEDLACVDFLACVALDAETLSVGVATVTSRANTLF